MGKDHRISDVTLYNDNALIFLGLQNAEWNKDAQDILAGRGRSYRLLRDRERSLAKNAQRKARGFGDRVDFNSIPPSSWLAPRKTGHCRDCNLTTTRRYNGYWQCEQCASAILNAGSRAEWTIIKAAKAEEKRRKQAEKVHDKAKEKLTETAEQKGGFTPSDVIDAYEAAFEDLLNEGAAPEVIKAAGDREVIQAAQRAYQDVKTNSPLAQVIQEIRHHAA